MDYSLTFARHFARLVWLLLHETGNIDEQKATLRALVAVSKEGPVALLVRDGEIEANGSLLPSALSGAAELVLRLGSHGLLEVRVDTGAAPADILSVARVIAGDATTDDGAPVAEEKVRALAPRTVHCVFRPREPRPAPIESAPPAAVSPTAPTPVALDRLATPPVPAVPPDSSAPTPVAAPPAVDSTAPTPAIGAPVQPEGATARAATGAGGDAEPAPAATSGYPGASSSAGPGAPSAPGLAGMDIDLDMVAEIPPPPPPPPDPMATPAAGIAAIGDAGTPSGAIVHESAGGMWMHFSATQTPKESPEALLAKLDANLHVNALTATLDDLVLIAENAAREGRSTVVADVFHGVVRRETGVSDPELRRAYVMAIRRLSRPPLLRAVAALLPRKREKTAEFVAVLVRTGEDGADALIDQLTQAQTAADRRCYYDVLLQLKAGVPALVHMLGDARWFVARNAADLLGEMKAGEAEGALIDLLRHRDDRVRRAATYALVSIGTPTALRAIHGAIRDDSPQVRMQAAQAIAARGGEKSAGTLTRALDDESDPEVQIALLTALGKIGTPDAIQKLVKAAEPDGRFFKKKPTPFRVAAVQALGEARTQVALAALTELTGDRDRDVRDAATRMLAVVKR